LHVDQKKHIQLEYNSSKMQYSDCKCIKEYSSTDSIRLENCDYHNKRQGHWQWMLKGIRIAKKTLHLRKYLNYLGNVHLLSLKTRYKMFVSGIIKKR